MDRGTVDPRRGLWPLVHERAAIVLYVHMIAAI
jgi:hypothetical protein